MIKLNTLAPAMMAVCAAGAIGGCGGSSASPKDQINSIITSEGSNPPSLCDHLTSDLLAKLGGKTGCQKAGRAQPKDPTTHATSITVNGSSASAVVVDRQGTRTIHLVKQGDSWKVSG